MSDSQADALVMFGATGDLAFKKIFPSLYGLAKRGFLKTPVVGIGRTAASLEKFRERVWESVEKHGGAERAEFEKLAGLLRYVNGDYNDPATYKSIREALGSSERPAYYLAIPPDAFGTVVEQLGKAGCTRGARVIVEKPFGTDLASARALNTILLGAFEEKSIFRIDHYLGKRPVHSLMYMRFANSFFEPLWNREHVESIQITMAESIGVEGRGSFYDPIGAIRDVVENHLFQVLTNLTMDAPPRLDSESIRDEKAKVLKAVGALKDGDVVRGQFRGYRSEKGVRPDSKTETFAAVRLEIASWRWEGVPIFIRAGKKLPVSATEVLVRLRRPPRLFPCKKVVPNYFRFRISPDVTTSLGMMTKSPCDEMFGEPMEMIAGQPTEPGEMDAYERVLHDALVGDQTLFAREDYIEEAWRIVDPVLKGDTPVHEYEPGTWGPSEASQVAPPDGWANPLAKPQIEKTA
jgi:glucose-6-phosphate 1-dehydrogenase